MNLCLVARKLSFQSTCWSTSLLRWYGVSAKFTLVSSDACPVHTRVIADQPHLEQRFLIDIKFNSNHLIFSSVNHMHYNQKENYKNFYFFSELLNSSLHMFNMYKDTRIKSTSYVMNTTIFSSHTRLQILLSTNNT